MFHFIYSKLILRDLLCLQLQFDCIITHVKLVKLKGKRHRLPPRQKQIIKEKLQRLEDGAIYYNDDYKNSDEEEKDAAPKVTRKKKGKILI